MTCSHQMFSYPIQSILERNGGRLYLQQKAGCHPYHSDPQGFRSQTAQALARDNSFQGRSDRSWSSIMRYLPFLKQPNPMMSFMKYKYCLEWNPSPSFWFSIETPWFRLIQVNYVFSWPSTVDERRRARTQWTTDAVDQLQLGHAGLHLLRVLLAILR